MTDTPEIAVARKAVREAITAYKAALAAAVTADDEQAARDVFRETCFAAWAALDALTAARKEPTP